MEDTICISCNKNCTENELNFINTEDGPVCELCIDIEEVEETKEEEHDF